MKQRKKVLLKLSGTIFQEKYCDQNKTTWAHHIVDQISQLQEDFQLGIVIGGGNFFRGNQQGKSLGIRPITSHYVGMISTIMNGILLQDLLYQKNVKAEVLSALFFPEFSKAISPRNITSAFDENDCIIFSGGTGNPFFTTDTNAVIRALEIGADQVWKATDVDGVYDSDPKKNNGAKLLSSLTHSQAKKMNLEIMDLSAFTLAEEHDISFRIFNVFTENSLLNVAENKTFGSTVSL